MAENALVDKRVRDEAAQWYAKLNNTMVSTDALRDFRAWRKEPACDEAYLEIEAFWGRVGKLEQDQDIKRAADEALARPSGLLARPGGRGLAGALLAAGLGVALAFGWQAYAGKSYSTGVGEQRLVRLEDGSRLRLDTDSQVRVRLGAAERRLELVSGQAFFEVAHDASRPFVVRARDTRITALGTRFDVSRTASGVEVTLVDGKVRVDGAAAGSQASWTLKPGQQLATSVDRATPIVRTVDAGVATSWTTGRLVFRGVPLAEAIAEVNRYSPRKVVLEAPDLAATPVTGAFDTGDTDAFVAAVGDVYDLRAEPVGEREIRLKPAA